MERTLPKHAPQAAAVLALALCATQALALPGVMLRDDDLRAGAAAKASVLGKAKKGKAVDILDARGGWTQVRLGAATGWVRLLSVRRGTASRADVDASLGSAQGALNNPYDPGAITATSGLRGLDLAELKAARYDAAQLARLDTFAVGRAEAEAHAAQAGLKARPLAYLPAPPSVYDTGLPGQP
jgi:hypothetical protein